MGTKTAKDLIQHLKPITPIKNLPSCIVVGKTDSEFKSAEFSTFMACVAELLKELAPDAFERVWTRSLFPERISQAGLRICEQHAQQQTTKLQADKDRLTNLLIGFYPYLLTKAEGQTELKHTEQAAKYTAFAEKIKQTLSECGYNI